MNILPFFKSFFIQKELTFNQTLRNRKMRISNSPTNSLKVQTKTQINFFLLFWKGKLKYYNCGLKKSHIFEIV